MNVRVSLSSVVTACLDKNRIPKKTCCIHGVVRKAVKVAFQVLEINELLEHESSISLYVLYVVNVNE